MATGVLLLGGAGGGAYWWLDRAPALPPGIAFSNGRLEADEIDVNTKFAGRVSEILTDEGTMVKEGQVVARMDTRDQQQQLSQAKAQIVQAQQSVEQNAADLVQMGSQLKLAAQELQRARILTRHGYETREVLDQRQSQFNVAIDKLMFRVRVRIDPALLRDHEAQVRSGLPGLAYIRLDATPWPPGLRPVIGG